MARNIIVFVADGLRPGAINATDTPTMFGIKQTGVNFANSHSLFPTFTMPNASAIATGHYLGDTGDFSNTVYTGYPVLNANGSVTPFIENDPVLADTALPAAMRYSLSPESYSASRLRIKKCTS